MNFAIGNYQCLMMIALSLYRAKDHHALAAPS